jgi:hypothetical protein
MTNDRDRLWKVLTLAMHPQTVPQEAHAAFLRARQIVKANPSLAHSPASETISVPKPPKEATFEATITSVHPDWILILIGALSRSAYKLDLKYQIDFDFSQSLIAINLVCHGSKQSCEAMEGQVDWAINYINDEISNPASTDSDRV